MTIAFRRKQFTSARRLGQPPLPKDRPFYVPVVPMFHLHQAVRLIDQAFPESWGVYLVGSCITKPDYRDVDVRCILPDDAFDQLFPASPTANAHWEPRWSLLSAAISDYLAKATGLPIDFQFQRATAANARYPGRQHPRMALGFDVSHGDARKA
jgi:hypothetical protein